LVFFIYRNNCYCTDVFTIANAKANGVLHTIDEGAEYSNIYVLTFAAAVRFKRSNAMHVMQNTKKCEKNER
jgi:hypothetical protein